MDTISSGTGAIRLTKTCSAPERSVQVRSTRAHCVQYNKVAMRPIQEMTEQNDWRNQVYAPSRHDPFYDSPEWKRIRSQVLRRDGYRCARCDRRLTVNLLTAHHVIPRAEGGIDDPINLLTLCNPCHDFVEIHALRTRAAIEGSINQTVTIETPPPPTDDWHTWVYGGAERPQRCKFCLEGLPHPKH